MSTKTLLRSSPVHRSIIPLLHHSNIPFPNVTSWSRVENLQKPLILLVCHTCHGLKPLPAGGEPRSRPVLGIRKPKAIQRQSTPPKDTNSRIPLRASPTCGKNFLPTPSW